MSELDDLMSLDPLELAKDDEKIDKIIAIMRQMRENLGDKPNTKLKGQTVAGKALIDKLKASGKIASPTAGFVRRI